MKKILPFIIAAVIAIGVYSCQKDQAVSKRSVSGQLEKTKKDTTPPPSALRLKKDTTPPPASFTTVAKDTTPPPAK